MNRYLAALSHALTVASREWGWLETHPLRGVSKLKEPRGRVRYLSDDERPALLQACRESANPDLYVAVVLALSTGARRGEILSLRWRQIDLTRRVITLEETKNGEQRTLPLTAHAFELMRRRVRRIDTDLVFPSRQSDRPTDLRGQWEAAVQRAGLKDFRFHDLRHSTASYLAMQGRSPAEIAAVLGHRTLQMVKRYAHISDSHTARVLHDLNEQLFGTER